MKTLCGIAVVMGLLVSTSGLIACSVLLADQLKHDVSASCAVVECTESYRRCNHHNCTYLDGWIQWGNCSALAMEDYNAGQDGHCGTSLDCYYTDTDPCGTLSLRRLQHWDTGLGLFFSAIPFVVCAAIASVWLTSVRCYNNPV